MTEIERYLVDTTDHRTVCTWLRMNDVDPNEIPVRTPILVEPDPENGFGEWRIRFEVFLRDGSGYRYIQDGTEDLATRPLTQRMAIDPPIEWLLPLTE